MGDRQRSSQIECKITVRCLNLFGIYLIMSDSNSLSNRYQQLIDSIVDITLKGKIRSKEQVYRMLVKEIESGTGEIFERILY